MSGPASSGQRNSALFSCFICVCVCGHGRYVCEGAEGFVYDGGLHWLRPLRMLLGEPTHVVATCSRTLSHMHGASPPLPRPAAAESSLWDSAALSSGAQSGRAARVALPGRPVTFESAAVSVSVRVRRPVAHQRAHQVRGRRERSVRERARARCH